MTILTEYARQAHVSQVLETYELPDGLLARVQRDNGWTEAFTLGAAAEYRRFVMLAATAPHPVTPSQIVDEVWHTHLMFTRDYWERLMPLLPKPLHHEPGTGAPGDGAHFAAQYLQTLDTYRQIFGTEPPAEYWPDPRQVPPAVSTQPIHAGRANWKLLVSAFVAGAAYLMSHALVFAVISFVVTLVFTTLISRSSQGQRSSSAGGSDGGGGLFVFGAMPFGSDTSGNDSTCTPDSGGSDSSCGDSGGSSCGSGCGGGCGSS